MVLHKLQFLFDRWSRTRTGLAVGAVLAVTTAVAYAWTRVETEITRSTNSIYAYDRDGTVTKTISAQPSLLRVAVAAMISPQPTRVFYKRLMELVGERVGLRVTFIQRSTYAEVNTLIESREVDMGFVCSGPYVAGHARFGMEILVVPVVDGESIYHSYFLAHRTSDIESLQDLKGKTFAFTDPDSNTGYLVPRYVLAQHGETPKSFFSNTYFTHSHDNSIMAVVKGDADGAAVDQLIWDFMNAHHPAATMQTKIIGVSPPYGIPPIVVHPRLDAALKQRLRKALLELHTDEAAVPLLTRIRVERFDEGDDAMYDTVRQMQRWLANTASNEE